VWKRQEGVIMFRKVLQGMIILVMVLALTACGGGGGSSNGTPQDTGQSGEYMSIEKSVFSSGETVTVTTTGITEEMEDADAFVAIYNAGAGHDHYQQYLYPQAGSDTLHFTAPTSGGNYEMRLFKQDYVYTDETFVESVAFTVDGGTTAVDTPSPPSGSGSSSGSGSPFLGKFIMTYTTHGGFGDEYFDFRNDGTFSFMGQIEGTFTVSGNTATIAMPGVDWIAEIDGSKITIEDPFSDVVMVFEKE